MSSGSKVTEFLRKMVENWNGHSWKRWLFNVSFVVTQIIEEFVLKQLNCVPPTVCITFLTRQIWLPLLDDTKLWSPVPYAVLHVNDTNRYSSDGKSRSHSHRLLPSHMVDLIYTQNWCINITCCVLSKILHLMVAVSCKTSNNHRFQLC